MFEAFIYLALVAILDEASLTCEAATVIAKKDSKEFKQKHFRKPRKYRPPRKTEYIIEKMNWYIIPQLNRVQQIYLNFTLSHLGGTSNFGFQKSSSLPVRSPTQLNVTRRKVFLPSPFTPARDVGNNKCPTMLLWITLLVFLLNLDGIQAGYKGTSITCECTTTHCLEHNTRQCNTTSVCFSQFLDRRDGSDPVVRGCIKSKTPLLCENRRPAVARGAWPLLLCCSSNMCNRDAVPTPPPWFAAGGSNGTAKDDDHNVDELLSKRNDSSDANTIQPLNGLFSFESPPQTFSATPTKKKNRFSSSLPHIISPIYISVLVLGIVSLIVIGIVATIVLKRSNRYYAEQYGALEHQYCLKHNNLVTPYNNIATPYSNLATPYSQPISQAQCDCDDSEVESLSQCSQHYVRVVYPNRVSNDT
ncbi:hypothetical protein JTE90_016884 [Oedothorax gibbosus]|uniref:BMP and activin membrane-bound inhibitor N-terminal domain-containing protein n=1 Tax=Oedothorax gibbosus TaxID=931172 RepID=A0AAV6U985_9ARAC|nr:hypothetical protein JTE90_016884 [Oedothorax gibbosus]